MAQKVVTLYLDDTSIRLMVTSGNRISKWDCVPLESGMVKNAMVLKPDEVAAKIRQIFKVGKIKSKKVILGVSGSNCITRPINLPKLPKEMLEEAVRREAKRALPVPPEQLYLQWQSISAPENGVKVFLVAIPRTATDALFSTLRLAGLKADLMDLKPMLLARMVKDTMAIIVDVQPSEFDIVVMAGGIPQPIRTMHFPKEGLSWQERISLIKDELNRTLEFYNSNNPESPLAPIIPVYVSGELASEAKQCQVLSDGLNRPVLPLPPPFESPDGLDPNRYMANMGLALKKIAPTNGSGLLVNSLNVMPTVYQPEPISLTRVLALPGAVIAISLLLFLALMTQNTSADIAEMRNQLGAATQLLQQKISQHQQSLDAIYEIEQKLNEAETLHGNFAAAVSNLEKQSLEVNGDLEVTVNSLPETVHLTSISHSSDALTFKGWAETEEEFLSYLRALETSERFPGITITSIRQAADYTVDFNVALSVGE